ncbi:CLT3, partial [Symbiodinium microadriaticum]
DALRLLLFRRFGAVGEEKDWAAAAAKAVADAAEEAPAHRALRCAAAAAFGPANATKEAAKALVAMAEEGWEKAAGRLIQAGSCAASICQSSDLLLRVPVQPEAAPAMVPLGEWLAWEEVFAAQPAPRSTVQKAAYRPGLGIFAFEVESDFIKMDAASGTVEAFSAALAAQDSAKAAEAMLALVHSCGGLRSGAATWALPGGSFLGRGLCNVDGAAAAAASKALSRKHGGVTSGAGATFNRSRPSSIRGGRAALGRQGGASWCREGSLSAAPCRRAPDHGHAHREGGSGDMERRFCHHHTHAAFYFKESRSQIQAGPLSRGAMAVKTFSDDADDLSDSPSSWRYFAACGAVLVAAAVQRRCRGAGHKSDAALAERLPIGFAALLAIATVALATANRVMYKVALVPLGNYVFFLAQFTTFGYVVAYWMALIFNRAQGNVTDQQVTFARQRWLTFARIGTLEAGSFLLGMLGAKALPGSILPVLGQLYLVFQMTFSSTLLGRTYSWRELAGCAFCVLGVILASAGGLLTGGLGSESFQVPWRPSLLFVLSLALPALGSVLKEGLFKDARGICGEELNVFVVNTLGSSFQAVGVFLLLPVLASLQGLGATPSAMAEYLNAGANAFGSQPFWPCLYLCLNLGFNVTLLILLRTTSAVTVSLSVAAAVPATALVFATCDIPLLGKGEPLDRWFTAGLALILLGLGLYHGWLQKLYPASGAAGLRSSLLPGK